MCSADGEKEERWTLQFIMGVDTPIYLFTEKEGISLDYQFGGTARGHINGSSIIMCMPLNFVPSVAKVWVSGG